MSGINGYILRKHQKLILDGSHQTAHAACREIRSADRTFKQGVPGKKNFFFFHIITAASCSMARRGDETETHSCKFQEFAILNIMIRNNGFRSSGLV